MSLEQSIKAYAMFFETLSRESVDDAANLCIAEVRFRDPFNDVRGVREFQKVLWDMFDTLIEPRFKVLDCASSCQVCYMRWAFTFRRKPGGAAPRRIEGMSEIHFDAEGKVTAHIDHWDAGQVYELIPVLGNAIRYVKGRISSS